MSKFHAGRIMASVVNALQENGVMGLDVDGAFDVNDADASRADYALAELDLVEVDELPEYANVDLSGAFRTIFDKAHRAFNIGRTVPTYWVTGHGYPGLPVGSRVLACNQRKSWSFSIEFYVMTKEMKASFQAEKNDKKKRGVRGFDPKNERARIVAKRPVS